MDKWKDKTLGQLIQLLSGYIIGGAILAEIVAFLVAIYVAIESQRIWVIAVALIALIAAVALGFLMYFLLCGFGQMVDDVRAMRDKISPDDRSSRPMTSTTQAPDDDLKDSHDGMWRCKRCGVYVAGLKRTCHHCGADQNGEMPVRESKQETKRATIYETIAVSDDDELAPRIKK